MFSTKAERVLRNKIKNILTYNTIKREGGKRKIRRKRKVKKGGMVNVKRIRQQLDSLKEDLNLKEAKDIINQQMNIKKGGSMIPWGITTPGYVKGTKLGKKDFKLVDDDDIVSDVFKLFGFGKKKAKKVKKKRKKGNNPWIDFFKKYKKEHPNLKASVAMKKAGVAWKKYKKDCGMAIGKKRKGGSIPGGKRRGRPKVNLMDFVGSFGN